MWKMKLNEAYIIWKDGGVDVVPKAAGIPKGVDNFFDPALWDQSDLSHLLFEWFAILTIGQYDIEPMKCPLNVWEALCESIDEFAEVSKGWRHTQPEDEAWTYKGDRQFVGGRKSKRARLDPDGRAALL